MNIELELKIEFPPKAIKAILIEYLDQEGYEVTEDFDFNLDEVCEGYGPAERYVVRFEGCTIPVKRKEI